MWEIWANLFLSMALKSCPKYKKSPNLVSLIKNENSIMVSQYSSRWRCMSRSLDRSEGGWVVYLKFAHSWCKSMLSLCSIDVDLVSEVYPHAFLLYDRPVEYLNLIFCYQLRLYLGTTIACKESYKALIYSEGISFYKLGLLPNDNFLFSKNLFCDFFWKMSEISFWYSIE